MGLEIAHGPEAMPAFDPMLAANERIGAINRAVLGTAVNLLPAAAAIGVLAWGFRKIYKETLGAIIP